MGKLYLQNVQPVSLSVPLTVLLPGGPM